MLRGAFFETKTCAFSKRSVFLLRGACFQTCQIICVFTCNPCTCSKPCCFIMCTGHFFPWAGHTTKHMIFYSKSAQMRVFRVRGALLKLGSAGPGRCFLEVFRFCVKICLGWLFVVVLWCYFLGFKWMLLEPKGKATRVKEDPRMTKIEGKLRKSFLK